MGYYNKTGLLRLRGFEKIFLLIITLFASPTYAHENWLLTPADVVELNNMPQPFQTNLTNIVITCAGIVGCMFWVWLSKTKIAQLFPYTRRWLYAHSDYAALLLRLGTGFMFLIMAFGLIPREGEARFVANALLAPDLEMHHLALNWLWLKWFEVFIGVGLILGIYTRVMSVLTIILVGLCFYLFGIRVSDYAEYYLGIACYLLVEGGQVYYLSLPSFKKMIEFFENAGQQKAILILQVLTGFNFIFTGIKYKIFHPNLDMGILLHHHSFTFGLPYDSFILGMAIIEILSGVLIAAGVLIRPLSLILICCFTFLAYDMYENPLVHVFIYGILFAFLLTGAADNKARRGS